MSRWFSKKENLRCNFGYKSIKICKTSFCFKGTTLTSNCLICDFTRKLFCKMIISMKITNHFNFPIQKKNQQKTDSVLCWHANWTREGRKRKTLGNVAAICICRQGWKTFPSVSLSMLLLWSKITQDDSKRHSVAYVGISFFVLIYIEYVHTLECWLLNLHI